MTAIPRSVIAAVLILLAGCQSNPAREPVCEVEIVEVRVPVPVPPDPPAELLDPPMVADGLPAWLEPTDPAASSALGPDGETRLKLLLHDLLLRDRAWREWGTNTTGGAGHEEGQEQGQRP